MRRALALNEHIASLDARLKIDLITALQMPFDNAIDPESLLQSNEVGDLVKKLG